MNYRYYSHILTVFFAFSVLTVAHAGHAVIGTSEPVQEAVLSFPESGRITEIPVKEGQIVQSGQLLSKLDTRVLDASLRIAKIRAESQSVVQSAEAGFNLRKRRYDELARLVKSGSANKDEVARAKAEFEIASADLSSAREEAESRKIEVERITAQIDQHTILSPFDGVVTRVHREVGEVIQPGQGPVLTLVRLNRLHLVLHINHLSARQLQPGQELHVTRLDEGNTKKYPATVDFVSPVTDAASSTTRVKISLDNPNGIHRAGLKYALALPEAGSAE